MCCLLPLWECGEDLVPSFLRLCPDFPSEAQSLARHHLCPLLCPEWGRCLLPVCYPSLSSPRLWDFLSRFSFSSASGVVFATRLLFSVLHPETKYRCFGGKEHGRERRAPVLAPSGIEEALWTECLCPSKVPTLNF